MSRSFCIYIFTYSENAEINISINDLSSKVQLKDKETRLIYKLPDNIISPALCSVLCEMGEIGIGDIQFDNTYIPNKIFVQKYNELYNNIVQNNFDLSICNDVELNLIEKHGLFINSGDLVFEGNTEFRINPKINGTLAIHSPEYKFPPNMIYKISTNQKFECDLTIPESAI